MRVTEIQGRQAVPIRAIPYLTQSDPLSPEVLATVLAESGRYQRWDLRAYQVEASGKLATWMPRQWDSVRDRLIYLWERIEDAKLTKVAGGIQWEDRSVELLPASVFVWRDELEREYARTFGKRDYVPPPFDPDVGSDFEDQGDLAGQSAPRYSHRRAGDRALDIDGMPEPEAGLRQLLFAGFEESSGPALSVAERSITPESITASSLPNDAVTENVSPMVSRPGVEKLFNELNWRPIWNKEKSNGLKACRVGKFGGLVHYDTRKFADWLWNRKHVSRSDAYRRLGLQSPQAPDETVREMWFPSSRLHRVK